MRVVGIDDADDAIALLARYFPRSAAAADRQRFLLRHLLAGRDRETVDAPRYPV